MLTLSIKLKKDIAGFKAGQTIKASNAAIAAHKLAPADYEPLGTYPSPVASDLPETVSDSAPASKKK